MKARKAIIVGSEGQDGRLLFDKLCDDHWFVIGLGRDSVRSNDVTPRHFDIASREAVKASLHELNPHAIFYLPAVHASSDAAAKEDDDVLFERSLQVHAQYAVNFLEALSANGSDASFFYAGSSHVFAGADVEKQTEDTPLAPRSIYAITKTAGIQACRYYRAEKKVRASVGFLYNHESHLRPEGFVSRRIVSAAVKAARGDKDKLVLGDLGACVDWGYAPDFVDAMVLISELPAADDYIVATGEPHSVRDFVEAAFEYVGADWRNYVVERPSQLTRRLPTLIGDPRRLKERTGWRPTMSFREMVRTLVDQAGTSAA